MGDLDPALARWLSTNAPVAVVICDGAGGVIAATPHAERLLGASPVPDLLAVVREESRSGLIARLAEALVDGDAADPRAGEVATLTEPPRVLSFEASAVSAPDRPGLLAIALHDVTLHHQRVAEVWRQATTDPLTGLATHGLFIDRLTQATRTARPGQVAVLDLDHFKSVNDLHGHGAGDEVLVEIARRLRRVTPERLGATIARIGGEEFAVLLPDCDAAAAASLVQSMLDAIAVPQQVGVITASAGVSPVVRRSGRRPAPVVAAASLAQADQALYAAKAAGRARMLVFGDDAVTARPGGAGEVAALRRENAALAQEARTDALTGAGNRRRFDEDLAAADARSVRRGVPYAVVFLDLDEFGLVNKAWEDEAGDRTLTLAAETIADAIRAGDALYRYGGEEFVALLPDATREGALGVCGRIRAALARRALPHPTRGRVSASIGVASSADHEPGAAHAVVTDAISAMRRAKVAGRDRIVSAWRPGDAPGVPRELLIEDLRWDDRR
ncbi:MAG TPA: diguanylate cyclase [Miltoncostaeaceae bacterium]|nr:diguanylate cyclase [Miltoncostaeaceae bacterium]